MHKEKFFGLAVVIELVILAILLQGSIPSITGMFHPTTLSEESHSTYDPYSKKESKHPFHLSTYPEGPLDSMLKSNSSQFTDGYNVHIPGFYVETNKEGMREEEFLDKPHDERILVIGDSLTFGWGVNRSDRFTDIVERKLNENSDKKFQLVNAGQPGYGMRDYFLYLKHRGLEYEPDRVVLAFSMQDAYSLQKDGEFRRKARRSVPRNASNRQEKIVEELKNRQSDFMDGLVLDNSDFATYLDRFDNTLRKEGVPVTYFVIRGIPDEEREEWFNRWAEERNRTLISAPEKLVYTPEGHVISKYDSHYNAEGHRILADKLYRNLNRTYNVGREGKEGILERYLGALDLY